MSGLNQRNRTSRRYITYIHVKLTHVILEAGKSQDLEGESSSWRPRRADVFISFWVPRPENQRASVGVPVQRLAGSRHRKSQYFSSSLQAGKTGVPIQKQSSKRNSPLLGGELSVRFRPSADWMQLTHIREGNLLISSLLLLLSHFSHVQLCATP